MQYINPTKNFIVSMRTHTKQSSKSGQRNLTDTFNKKVCEGLITTLKDAQYHWSGGYSLKTIKKFH